MAKLRRMRGMLGGRELSDDELARVRKQIEQFVSIVEVSDEMRALIADQWPELLTKIVPERKH
jgi:hypothetical protein